MTTITTEFEKTEMGTIQIAPEVIEVIAGLATSEVEGVMNTSGSFVNDFLGRKNHTKGIKVEAGNKQAAIDVSVVISYGYRIPEVANKIQHNVKQAIESMTGLSVVEVNVHVLNVEFKGQDKQITEEPAGNRVK